MGVPMKMLNYPVPASKGRESTDNVWQTKGYARFHGGNDVPPSVKGKEGEAVMPCWPGEVVFAEPASSHKSGSWGSDYGNRVLIRHKKRHTHANGTEHWHDWFTFYAHLRTLKVKKGQTVTGDQAIGTLGDTGNSDGSHVHFALQLDPGWLVGVVDPHSRLEKARKA